MSSTRPSRKEFRRVRKSDSEEKPALDNEIRVTSKGSQRLYITYAIATLLGQDDKKKYDTITISGMGAAIYNAVNIAEIVKRRVPGVSQITDISSQTLQDEYEAIEDGKDDMTVERKVSTILITLSTKALDSKHIGYQAPLPEDQVTEQEDRKPGATLKERPEGGRREKKSDDKPARGGRRGGRGRGEKKPDDKKAPDAKPARGGRGEKKSDDKPARGSRGGRGEKKSDDKPARGGRGEKKSDDKPARGGRGGRGGRDEKPARGGRDEKPAGRGRGEKKSDDKPARGGRGGRDEKPARGGRGGRSERGGRN